MSYKVKLEVFEGPLDLLLYLIKKNEIDIYDIPITTVTEQYLEYLDLMRMLDLNIAGEFLVMAATLIHVKSKMLLPPEEKEILPEEEEDPREELVRRLLEYKRFKEAAGVLQDLEGQRRQMFTRAATIELESGEKFFEASLFDLITALTRVLKDVPKDVFQEIVKDEFTVEQKVHDLLHILVGKPVIFLSELFKNAKNKLEIITTFLAVLELIRLKEILVVQKEKFGDIEVIRNEKHRLRVD
ncbi:MAG: segregation/condensation protein A [Candidatus Omnitrophica bacterium]|nr:segregation/condensation protein A [Candidatus Omnitrophota bacterium]MBU1933216.1 segregation/condensation protein A [Candidatus Omnitrophota bacterium]